MSDPQSITIKRAAEVLLANLDYDGPLNEAGWAADDAWVRHTKTPVQTMFFNHIKPILLDSIKVYLEGLIKENTP